MRKLLTAGFIALTIGVSGATSVQATTAPGGPVDPGADMQVVEYFQFQVRHSKKCLDVAHASSDDKAAVIQYTCGIQANQEWRLVPVGTTGYFRFVAHHSGKCLDIWNASRDDTADAIQYACSDDKEHQQFKRVATSNHYVQIRARHSNKCLAVEGASHDDKVQVHQ
ncbi:MAG TPA: RICIN domain-containing protein, partial [Acidimicrobiales bacterium]|nr:RICIN domain-containing protein [Acidimicrobiales bacterium]